VLSPEGRAVKAIQVTVRKDATALPVTAEQACTQLHEAIRHWRHWAMACGSERDLSLCRILETAVAAYNAPEPKSEPKSEPKKKKPGFRQMALDAGHVRDSLIEQTLTLEAADAGKTDSPDDKVVQLLALYGRYAIAPSASAEAESLASIIKANLFASKDAEQFLAREFLWYLLAKSPRLRARCNVLVLSEGRPALEKRVTEAFTVHGTPRRSGPTDADVAEELVVSGLKALGVRSSGYRKLFAAKDERAKRASKKPQK
jgi:hypothetical protein